MGWLFSENRPRLWRFVALLLIGYVAYLAVPIVFGARSSPFQRVFATMAILFFTYLILRSVPFWESFLAETTRKR
jgi:hypothetical protein